MYNKGVITVLNNKIELIIATATFFVNIMSSILTLIAKLILRHLPYSEVLNKIYKQKFYSASFFIKNYQDASNRFSPAVKLFAARS